MIWYRRLVLTTIDFSNHGDSSRFDTVCPSSALKIVDDNRRFTYARPGEYGMRTTWRYKSEQCSENKENSPRRILKSVLSWSGGSDRSLRKATARRMPIHCRIRLEISQGLSCISLEIDDTYTPSLEPCRGKGDVAHCHLNTMGVGYFQQAQLVRTEKR